MVNVNMLKAKIIEKNIEKKKIAECLGISPTSLNYKINGKTEFKGSEIQLLSKILGIENEKDAFCCHKATRLFDFISASFNLFYLLLLCLFSYCIFAFMMLHYYSSLNN